MCQLKHIDEFVQKGFWLDTFSEYLRKKLQPVKILLYSQDPEVCSTSVSLGGNLPVKSLESPIRFQPGDFVRVLPADSIKSMLDKQGNYKGCPFMPEMYNFTGKIYKVLKEVDCFYDEVERKLSKTKNLYILEGVVCSGIKKWYFTRCDLNCFFFWDKDFLDNI